VRYHKEQLFEQQKKPNKAQLTTLSATNLTLGNRRYPHKHEVHDDHHYTDDPEHARIVCVVVSKDDGIDDTTKVTCCANDAREDALRKSQYSGLLQDYAGNLPLACG
jgi:hypothetical protein